MIVDPAEDDREFGTGRFTTGRSGNPKGRPRKSQTVDHAILKAMGETVTINQGGRRRRRTKVDVAATQLANKSAAGDLRATKMTFDYAQKAHDRKDEGSGRAAPMTASDLEIAERVIARMRRIVEAGGTTTEAARVEPSDEGGQKQ
jgi:hypothetical protein